MLRAPDFQDKHVRTDKSSPSHKSKLESSSVPIPQPDPESPSPSSQRNPPRSTRYERLRFWGWEALAIAFAIGLVVAMAVVPAHYNGSTEPKWPYDINLNTLVAILATLMRAFMLVVVAEVISQLKWTSFDRPRPLSNVQHFDNASRSVFGSLTLLWSAPTSFWGVIGALITIFSLGVGPLTQQAIKLVPCTIALQNMTSSLPVAHYVPGKDRYYRYGAGQWEVTADMKAIMVNGLANPNGNDTAITAECETGDCDFSVGTHDIPYASIGMCSACIDTTSLVPVPADQGPNAVWADIVLPNGLRVENAGYTDVGLNVTTGSLEWATNAFTPGFAQLAHIGLANVTVLTISQAPCINNSGVIDCPRVYSKGQGNPHDFVAVSCTLYPCLKSFRSTVRGGKLRERLISTVPAELNWVERGGQSLAAAPYTALQTPCRVGNSTYDLESFSKIPPSQNVNMSMTLVNGTNYTAPEECLYSMEYLYGRAITSILDDLFRGYCIVSGTTGMRPHCNTQWWLSVLFNESKASFDSINTIFDQFAGVVTNGFRKTGSGHHNITASGERFFGSIYSETICTSFDWRWLILPFTLVLATLLLLVAAVLHSFLDRSEPVWKSSILPLLLYGIKKADDKDLPVMDLKEMNEFVEGISAKFQKGEVTGYVEVTESRRS